MANLCDNHVHIHCTNTKTKHIIENIFQQYEDCILFKNFGALVEGNPINKPKHDNYGTRYWDFTIDADASRDTIYIYGVSAWSPPLQLLIELSKRFDIEITGEYSESGMDFGGNYSISKGDYNYHNEYTYLEYLLHNDHEYAWTSIMDNIADGNYTSLEEILEAAGDYDFEESFLDEIKDQIKKYNET